MRLDLREIINVPGGRVPFAYEPALGELGFDGVKEIRNADAAGEVRSSAGVLTLTADLEADLTCVCARCLQEFPMHKTLHVEAVLAAEAQDEDNPDIFLLDGTEVDLDEVIVTAFVLNMEPRFLCREDCRGLCDRCGKNLNDGPCGCGAEQDPRLAILGQLLENE